MSDPLDVIISKINELQPFHQVAFAALMAERLLPQILAYNDSEGEMRPRFFRALDRVWGHVKGTLLSDYDIKATIDGIEDFVPDMDDIDDENALDACNGIAFAIRSCKRPASCAGAVAETGIDVVGRAIGREKSEPSFWDEPAVRNEVEMQIKMIDTLSARPPLTDDIIESIRHEFVPQARINNP